jgi:hypothetical protein
VRKRSPSGSFVMDFIDYGGCEQGEVICVRGKGKINIGKEIEKSMIGVCLLDGRKIIES